METPDFNKYYRNEELTAILQDYAQTYPNLVKMESIGKTFEGRDVWVITVTNFETGSDREKPAFFIDANVHAIEVSTATISVYFINALVTGYGKIGKITHALDTRTFYIIPRLCPDGAELALADNPRFIRSGTRPYPYVDAPQDGLMEYDIDGDGRILLMRIEDPNGTWKEHPEYPGLLIRREPDEDGGKYYRVLPEGMINDFDGDTIDVRSIHGQVTWPRGKWPKETIDYTATYPAGYGPEPEQLGSGPFPASEAEIYNELRFITDHTNIGGSVFFHAFGAMLIRPYDDRPDSEFFAEDLRVYKRIGDKGTEMTGYPNIRVFPDFVPNAKDVRSGTQYQWSYEHAGHFAWLVETWNPMQKVGLENYQKDYYFWFGEHSVEDDVKIYKWVKETLGNDGYADWREFDHPQLGKVELGGWNWAWTWANTPPMLLEKEAELFPEWLVWNAMILPKLGLRDISANKQDGDTYRVRLVIENTGFLPTYVTKKALQRNIRGTICEIELPEGASLVTGKLFEDVGQMDGRAYKDALLNPRLDATTDRIKVEWLVHAPKGGTVKVIAHHDRAGIVKTEVELKK